MKSLFYLLILSLLALVLPSLSHTGPEKTKDFTLQANVSSPLPLLKQTAEIITNRLTSYGLKGPEVIIVEKTKQLVVKVPEKTALGEIEGLLISKGVLTFYETLTLDGIADKIKSESKYDPSDARIGCSESENTDMKNKVEDYLKAHNLISECKLFWGIRNNESKVCLYALKVTGNPVIERQHIETIKASPDSDSNYMIEIKLKSGSWQRWENATRENLNHPIAIVVDNKVYYTPVVKTAIQSGLCVISGNQSQKEVNYFLSLVNNSPLPIELKIQK